MKRLVTLLLVLGSFPALAQNDITQWFREAKFGMFIHWGIYSVPANDWHGEHYFGNAEWIRKRAKISTTDYEAIAGQFNPTHFDAEEWVLLAKSAGMKYIVITSKHHDGFAMFYSKASKFNVVDATPFKRDPLSELAVACKKHGIKLGFYYSQTQDWHEPDAEGNNWEYDPKKADFGKYLREKCMPQLQELLTNYGDLGLIWFDTPERIPKEDSQKLVDWVHSLQPKCLTSSRVGNGLGDYLCLGDHELPTKIIERPFEALYTHNDTWGYSKFDKNFRSPKEIVKLLVYSNSKGGNLLLNVGPKADGTLPAESVNDLKTIAQWMKKNSESIHGSTHSLLPDYEWGTATAKPNRLFLHLFEYPQGGVLRIPSIQINLKSVRLLADKKSLNYQQQGNELVIYLPQTAPDALDTVVELNYEGEVKAQSVEALTEGQAGVLIPEKAELSGGIKLGKARWMVEFGNYKSASLIEGWKMPSDKATWRFVVPKASRYYVYVSYHFPSKNPNGRPFLDNAAINEGLLTAANDSLYFQVLPTGDRRFNMLNHRIGIVSLAEGEQSLSIQPHKIAEEGFFKVAEIKLVPVK
ncbi:MAG: alpha-L-fucosidase [Spirosomataceae bacterium]